MISPGPPHSFQLFDNARGPRATSGARPVVMNRRNSLPPLSAMPVVQAPRPYSVSGADGRWGYSGEGKCNAGRGALNGQGRGVTKRPEASARRASGCNLSAGVCCRTRLRLADRCSRFAVTSVWFAGISRRGGQSAGSALWETFVGSGQSSPEARGSFCWQRNNSLSTLGGTRATSGARADGHKQAEFTSAVT